MQLNFDASTVNPISEAGGFLPVSDEKGHLVVVTEWPNEPTENKSGKGAHVPITIKIIEGPLAGTEGVHRLNMYHNDEGPRKAAYQELSALVHVIKGPNNLRIGHSSELLNQPFRMVSVKQKPDDPENTYTQLARNGIRDRNGNKPGEAGNTATTQANQPPQTQQQPQGGAAQGGGWNPNAGNSGQGQPASGQGQPASGSAGGWNPQGGAQQPQGGQQMQPPQGDQPAWGGAPQGGGWNPQGGNGGGTEQKPAWVGGQ